MPPQVSGKTVAISVEEQVINTWLDDARDRIDLSPFGGDVIARSVKAVPKPRVLHRAGAGVHRHPVSGERR